MISREEHLFGATGLCYKARRGEEDLKRSESARPASPQAGRPICMPRCLGALPAGWDVMDRKSRGSRGNGAPCGSCLRSSPSIHLPFLSFCLMGRGAARRCKRKVHGPRSCAVLNFFFFPLCLLPGHASDGRVQAAAPTMWRGCGPPVSKGVCRTRHRSRRRGWLSSVWVGECIRPCVACGSLSPSLLYLSRHHLRIFPSLPCTQEMRLRLKISMLRRLRTQPNSCFTRFLAIAPPPSCGNI
ncbi:hypothetical protein B0J12DRAFT_366709 [Macrophomina phaseolina]|uniref:Uncharacterized protein n=1 Tax=Macrophomina phaseolina TaxID=35725 RepID=A0ABQ8FTE7_9PEZI|nr:hypothetical protein B0J12DRAFT_366709 [Macrophomina phaseolina]